MVRKRLAIYAATGALGLVCGCSNLCNYPVLDRLAHPFRRNTESAEVPEGVGPPLEECGPFVAPGGPVVGPGMPVPGNGSGLVPQNTVPNLAPPPRIVPQPQSQPIPYVPPG
jgi:hypothetical protein